MTTQEHDDDVAAPDAIARAEDIDRDSLDHRCLRLYQMGVVYRDIASQLGVSLARAHRGVERARAAMGTVTLDDERRDALAVLNMTLSRVFPILSASDKPDRQLRAAQTLVSVIDRKARLLGMDAPVTKLVELRTLTPEALDEERERLRRELEAAGIDLALLPTPDALADAIEASAVVTEPDVGCKTLAPDGQWITLE